MDESGQLECRVLDLGLFLGFTTTPIGREYEFFQKVIHNGLFKSYQKAVEDNFTDRRGRSRQSSRHEFSEWLYKPRAFFSFGRFDLAVLSIIDDFEFGMRTFGPFDPMCEAVGRTDPDLLGFSHQVVLGPIPRTRHERDARSVAEDIGVADSAWKLPLIAICQMRINSGAFLGAGLDMLHFIMVALRNMFEVHRGDSDVVRLFISESYSWHELTLILFGSSYRIMLGFILDARELTFGRLKENLSGTLESSNDPLRYREILEETDKNRLNAAIISTFPDFKDKDPQQCHVFESSATTYGFDLGLYDFIATRGSGEVEQHLKEVVLDEEVVPICRWFTKAGHLQRALRCLHEYDHSEAMICIGKGDFVYPIPKPMKTRELLQRIVGVRKAIGRDAHVLASSTTILQAIAKPLGSFDDEKHLLVRKRVTKELIVTEADIAELDRNLTRCGIPKTISERVENMFANFNDGITDPSLFGYFLELKPVMGWLLKEIDGWAKSGLSNQRIVDRSNFLSSVVNAFETAYKNRFFSGYRMNEITDFNLEFKGALQQLTSAFDVAFKAISAAISPDGALGHVFSAVGGAPWVSASEYSLSLNYVHIYQPEFFASFIGHEVGYYESVYPSGGGTEIPDAGELGKFSRRYGERPHDKTMKVLQILTIPEFFSYVFRDLMSYHLCYLGDPDLFTFWYWAHWYTLPNSHKSISDLDELSFVAMLMRVVSVLRICGADGSLPVPQMKDKSPLSSLTDRWIEPTTRYLKMLWEEEAFNRWGEDSLRSSEEKLFNAVGSRYHVGGYRDIAAGCSEASLDLSRQLAEGRPIRYRPHRSGSYTRNPSIHAVLLLHAYLLWMRSECIGKNPFLRRSPENGRVQIIPGDAPFMFDPRGGTFTHDPAVRRAYFRYRAALVLSFLDMSAVEKRNWVMDYLSRRTGC